MGLQQTNIYTEEKVQESGETMHRNDNPVTSIQMESTKRPQVSVISQIQKDKRFILWYLKMVGWERKFVWMVSCGFYHLEKVEDWG